MRHQFSKSSLQNHRAFFFEKRYGDADFFQRAKFKIFNFQIVVPDSDLFFAGVFVDLLVQLFFYRVIPDGGLLRPPVHMYLVGKIFYFEIRQQNRPALIEIKPILAFQIFIKWIISPSMEKKKEAKEAYATDDPTDTSAEKQENMAKEAIKKFKSLG